MNSIAKGASAPETADGDALRATAKEMVEAAWREGIDEHGPLGVFVRSMHATILVMADVAERQANAVVNTVREARLMVEAEAMKARKACELAFLAVEAAKTAHASFEVQKDEVVAKMVKETVPQMVKAVGGAVVIRERRYNWTVHWGRAAGIAAIAGGLLFGGYTWGSWRPDNAALSGAVALERIRQCEASPIRDERTKDAFCPLKALLAPS